MQRKTCDSASHITICNLLPASKKKCNSTEMSEVSKSSRSTSSYVTGLVQYSILEPPCATRRVNRWKALSTQVCQKRRHQAVRNISNFTQQHKATSILYEQTIWGKSVRCGKVYHEATLNGIFIKGLLECICSTMRHH